MREITSGSVRRPVSRRPVSCGVIVTDRSRILMGHATRSPRWDIPKGVGEAGETHSQTASRELFEESGLSCPPSNLTALGIFAYLKGKDLALFAWYPVPMPDPTELSCASTFRVGDAVLPEFDRFALFAWDEAMIRAGKNLARILGDIAPGIRPA